jgi:precorrin-6Y C5,15-methyltransferase (decarboxylating)
MSSDPLWLSIIGLGEDGPDGLAKASRAALENAEIVMGPPRHLGLLPDLGAELVEWPVPFSDGIALLKTYAGRRVVVLASGDPFWFGAGAVLARHFAPQEWRAYPGVSSFALAAARLGWSLEKTFCTGLHAAPYARLKSHLHPGARMLVTLRDGAAVGELAAYLTEQGFGESDLTICEALGGPRERLSTQRANALQGAFGHPVLAAIEVAGQGAVIPLATGRADEIFASDGQITKRPVRALTLSALAPRPGERLWDIGGGSGSIGIEWLMCHPTLQAVAVEPRADRADRIAQNAASFGVDHLQVVTGKAPDVLDGLPLPDVVFIGGGLSEALLEWLWTNLPAGTRLVANAVTLESEAVLAVAHAARGGDLLRIELAQSAPLGPRRGWKSAYPVVQWSVTL